MIVLDKIEDFDAYFDSEEKCIEYLWSVRSEITNSCYICGCERLYSNNDKKTKKCSNKDCRAKLTIKCASFFSGSKCSIKEIIGFIYLYTKTRGRWSATKALVNPMNAYIIDEKLKEIFSTIQKENMPTGWVFHQACCRIFILKDKAKTFFRKGDINKDLIINPLEVISFNDEKTYKRLILFINKSIYNAVRRRYIFHKFCDAEDIFAEAILYLADSSFDISKGVTGGVFVKIVYSTIYKMWKKYEYEHPNLQEYYRQYNREYKVDGRAMLKDWYIKGIINSIELNAGKWATERSKKEWKSIIEKKRASIREKRNKSTKNSFI